MVMYLRIRQIKGEIRIVGVDDARFERGRDLWTRLVGVVYRGGQWIEGCMQTPIRVDGEDATSQLCLMVKNSAHYGQLRVIMTRDTIFGGVNVLDLPAVVETTGLPIIAVSDSEPDMERVVKSLKRHSPKTWERKQAILLRCGPIRTVESKVGSGPIYIQWAGIPLKQVIKLVQKTAIRSRIPEPIRVAHLFATSFVPNPIES